MPVLRRLLTLLSAGLLLRLLLAWFPRPLDDDTDVYAELGRNLLHAGTYGIAAGGTIDPSLFRLPGYPLVLGLLGGHIPLVLALQIALDLTGCLLLADAVRRHAGARAGWCTLGLSATCLFTAIYAAIPLTECLSVFAVSGALWSITRLLDRNTLGTGAWRARTIGVLPLAAFSALAMLLRPDGALIPLAAAATLLWHALRKRADPAPSPSMRSPTAHERVDPYRLPRALTTAVLFCVLAAIPLVPWTIRNALTFHVFQPLAPRHVNDPGERVNLGFYRWLRTWAIDFSTTGQVFWHVGSEPIDLADLPPRAFDSPAERTRTAALLARYDLHHDLDPGLDDDFAALAADRIRTHPLRYFVWVPALRVADMWLRPRVDGTYLPSDWATLTPPQWAQVSALGLLNLLYVVCALASVLDATTRRRLPAGVFMALYAALRCVLLATIENAEPRYTLEAYPIVLVSAGVWLARRHLPPRRA